MRTLILVLGLLATCPHALAQQRPGVNLRPIDRATVRIISLQGVEPLGIEGRRSRIRRIVGDASTSHGSGVVIAPRVVLTARHVIWGANAWLVVLPGSSEPHAALPIYVDAEHDIAFLATVDALPHRIELPAASRELTLSEQVSASGYPLDLREYTPAATSGQVSRVTRSGELHLAMTVNPGHSGGPVIDVNGRLVGILSARGRVDRGVEGLSIAVPLATIREVYSRVPSPDTAVFSDEHRDIAAGMAWLAGVGDDTLLPRASDIEALIRRARAWNTVDADRDAVLATLAWNTLLELLEAQSAREVTHLAATARQQGQLLHDGAVELAQRALRTGPHVRRRFPVLRAIAIGRTVPYAPTERQ